MLFFAWPVDWFFSHHWYVASYQLVFLQPHSALPVPFGYHAHENRFAMVREQAIIYFVNGYIVSLTFVSVWILWLDVLLIINGYLLSLSVWCFQGTFWLLTQSYDPGSFLRSDHCSVSFWSGGHLFSHTVSSAVPSAAYVLTVVFGMGTGVSHKRIATRSLLLSLDN